MYSTNGESPERLFMIRRNSVRLSAAQVESIFELTVTDRKYLDLEEFAQNALERLSRPKPYDDRSAEQPNYRKTITLTQPSRHIVKRIGEALFTLNEQNYIQ